MHISRISTINFNGIAAKAIKKAAKSADEKLVEKTKDDFVNYNQSSYSVPTGFFPTKKQNVESYSFMPEDSVISNEYLKEKQASKQAEDIIDYVSESTIEKK